MVDADGDGYPASVDCNDDVPSINPSATDVVGDYIDQNCDGLDGVDADGDGFADVDSGGDDCDDADAAITPDDGDGDGVSSCDGDCNDGDSAISPSTLETCTGLDNDCDGQVDLTSIGLDTCLRVDISTVTFEADVLFVIDDSCSMLEEQGRLAATAFDFIDPLWATVDLHIGVVTTDMDNPARSGSLQYVGLYNYVDNTTQGLSQLDVEGWLASAMNRGAGGSPDERGIEAAYMALEILSGTSNAGFVRPTARQHIIVLSDEDDFSTQIDAVGFRDWAVLWKSSADMVRWHSIVSPNPVCATAALPGDSYVWLTTALGGEFWSVCQSDYATEMDTLAVSMIPGPPTEFTLSEVPDVATINVSIAEAGGAIVVLTSADWTFDALTNTLTFSTYVPPTGSTVTIDYRVVP
jgi:hypothetical protein